MIFWHEAISTCSRCCWLLSLLLEAELPLIVWFRTWAWRKWRKDRSCTLELGSDRVLLPSLQSGYLACMLGTVQGEELARLRVKMSIGEQCQAIIIWVEQQVNETTAASVCLHDTQTFLRKALPPSLSLVPKCSTFVNLP